MPKRKRVIRFPSDEIQGKGSWILAAQLTVAEVRVVRKLAKKAHSEAEIAKATDTALADDSVDMFEIGIDALKSHVRKWNWVDDDGEPMPQPKDDSKIIEKLSELESTFLLKCVRGSEEEAKN